MHLHESLSTATYINISMDILTMRKLSVIKGDFTLTDEVEIVFEKTVTPFGNSAKLDVPKRYLGKRAYVLILNDGED